MPFTSGGLVVRATLAWIFTLIAGLAAALGVATLVLLPTQADNNRVIYAKAERYAEKLVAGATPPLYEDHAFNHDSEGARFWHSRPSECPGMTSEAPSDTLVVGFWDSGSDDNFEATWYHCYAYPSGKTTLNLSVASYLESDAGAQVLAYGGIAMVAGLIAWLLGLSKNGQSLSLRAKAIWFTAFILCTSVFDGIQDYGDDEFHKMPDYIKWFDLAYREGIGSAIDPFFDFKFLPAPIANFLLSFPLIYPITLFVYAWLVGKSVSLLMNRRHLTQRAGGSS